MALNVGVSLALRVGGKKLFRKIATKETKEATLAWLGKEVQTFAQVAARRQATGLPILPGLENQAMADIAKLGISAIQKGYRATPAGKWVSGQAAPAVNKAISDQAFRFKRYVILQRGGSTQGRPVEALRRVVMRREEAWNRFGRRALNTWVLDYAQYQLINLGIKYTNQLLGNEDEKERDPQTIITGHTTQIAGHQVSDDGSYSERFEQALIAVAVGTVIRPQLNRFRRNNISLATVSKSTATRYGTRLSQNTMGALQYYGSRKPEVAGNITGGLLAMISLGMSPQDAVTAMGIRGTTNAAVAFYNFGKQPQMRLPTIGPKYRHQPFSVKKVKKMAKSVKKVKKVNSVFTNYKVKYNNGFNQGTLF